jgi:hypothetical protein
MTYTQVWDHMRNQPHDGIIQRDEDGAFIPMDPDNIDCQEYLAWLDDGNEPKSAEAPTMTLPETVPVEDRVSDLEDRVNALEGAPPEPPEETPEQVPIQVTTTRTITKGKK